MRARWNYLQSNSTLPVGSVLWLEYGGKEISSKEADKIRAEFKSKNPENPDKDPVTVIKLKSVSWLVDNAFDEIENANSKLKGIISRISQFQLESEVLIGLINGFSNNNLDTKVHKSQKLNLKSKDILGHVYEYFLGEFALAEGKKGGQYYTPKAIVTLITEMLQPYKGRVYDPAMGTGGFFVSSEKFIEEHAREKHYNPAEQKKKISIYGQESNPTTWRLAAMNMSIRAIDFNFGKKNADSFLDDQHPDLRADFIMTNPPFNMKEWWHERLADDVRWKYGTPPQGNANFAWMQHMIHHLSETGSMALLLANGSMSSNTNSEGDIRKNILKNDLIECMVALPGQLFTNTQIPACVWFITKDKSAKGEKRNRKEEVLFIDARNKGYMKDRVLRDFSGQDIKDISEVFHNWQKGQDYENKLGFCFSAKLEDIEKHDFILTPGRYVGAVEQEDDGIPFAEKMADLTAKLKEQFAESNRLEKEVKKNLSFLGYEI
mgnify:CR=1 FL=1